VRAYIQYGWADTLADPDNTSVNNNEGYGAPESDELMTSNSSILVQTVPNFTNVQIFSYFITRKVCNTHLCGDFKVINKSAMNLFRCSHLQQVEVCNSHDKIVAPSILPSRDEEKYYL